MASNSAAIISIILHDVPSVYIIAVLKTKLA